MRIRYCNIATLIENDENFSNDDLGLSRTEVLRQILLPENNIPINKNHKDKLTEKNKIYFLDKLKTNNNEVEYEKLEKIIDILFLELKDKQKWLVYEDVQYVFKNHIVTQSKAVYKSPILKEMLFDVYFSLLESDEIFNLEKIENRKLFKDVFKTIMQNTQTKNDMDISYNMLIDIVFNNKEKFPLDFVQEIGGIYLTNPVLNETKEYKDKLQSLNNWLKTQDLSNCYIYNKELKYILEKNASNDLVCTKIFIDYVSIAKDKKLTIEQLKKTYDDAVKVVSEKVLETEEVDDFIIQEKKNILIIYITYIKPNSYVNIIKKFFNHYLQDNVENMNQQYAEKLFLKCKIENNLENKNNIPKINKI